MCAICDGALDYLLFRRVKSKYTKLKNKVVYTPEQMKFLDSIDNIKSLRELCIMSTTLEDERNRMMISLIKGWYPSNSKIEYLNEAINKINQKHKQLWEQSSL